MNRPWLRLTLLVIVAVPATTLLTWLLGGETAVASANQLAMAVAVVFGVACVYFPMLGLPTMPRSIGWLICIAFVAMAPLLIPACAGGLRFLIAVLALTTIWKLYDLHRSPACGRKMGFLAYLAYLPNWFWFVCERPPAPHPARRDLQQVAFTAPLLAGGIALAFYLFQMNWSAAPFLAEHCIKVAVVFFIAVQLGQLSAALLRLIGLPADDPMNNPFAARTPADFWRRWNRPIWQFLNHHVFTPLGGRRRLPIGVLSAFAVSGICHEYLFAVARGSLGWQMLFFLLQGCATLLTLRIKPRGYAVPFWIAGTLAFNLASSLLLFRSFDSILPFYWRRR